MEKVSLINIFKVFFKIGMILLGGGYVIVPILNDELVKKRNWLSEDEVCDYFSVSQCLPGIVAINTSILVGYRLMKFKGALSALFAVSLSPFIVILLIANIIQKIANIPFVESIFWGVNISLIILIYLALKDIWKKSIVDKFSCFWFLFILFLCIIKINPAILVIASIIVGLIIQKFKGSKKC